MNKIVLILKTISSLIPIIISIVKALEEAFPEGGKGREKLDIAQAMLESAFGSVNSAEATFVEIWPTVQAIIAKLVSMYNSLGIFKKEAQ